MAQGNIILVRHGESVDNLKKVIQRDDNPLTERGILGAERSAESLSGYNVVGIVSSSSRRAFQTGEIIKDVLGFSGEVEAFRDFKAPDCGDVIGTDLVDIVPFSPLEYAEKNSTGESSEQFFSRVLNGWERIKLYQKKLKQGEYLVVVGHRSVFSLIDALSEGKGLAEGIENRRNNVQRPHGIWRIL